MIPASFDYVRATSLAHAIGLLREDPDGTKLVAGGHTLIPTLKLRLASPALLIDIGDIEELKGIEIADSIRIGALTTHAELLASEPLRKLLPIFHQTGDLIADPQVRNRGTIGGSLANADPAADWPAVVVALRAELELAGPNGRKRVAAKDFFVDIMTTALKPEEVLVAIHVPRPAAGAHFRYRKIRHPASGYAVVGVAIALCLQDNIVSEAAIGITGATGRAFAADAASARLIGKSLSSENIEAAASLASEQAECLSDHYASADYRKHLVKTEVFRALASLSAV
ncbi:carbon-monoxide dehydrogenase medium subunit [Bradyrhizobium lablabi]|jgi:carbon-monoxide dehydrogenase medium subunit|uniref:Carbon-monoxide dehydrogenase medium subunit n=1 Tax=Bradyrhizobium lablabi TaxID=722472 RepID=A0A1M6K5P9_9BRAD|nr:xanthine dehydrogenase family protein subunit M [Bradyrhizobium lablabi]SHJ54150.1 carbon-monoxide dehydrogenase medium subunit [Bradyrhizobium lablabi]